MDKATALADLASRFTWKKDKGESWRILKGSGPVTGDCEDFALTIVWLVSGRSLWRFWWLLVSRRFVIVACARRGVPHAFLRSGSEWTDNIFKTWQLQLPPDYDVWFSAPPIFVALKFLLRPVLRIIGR